MFTISYNDVLSIRRHQSAIDIKYGSLNQPDILQCQVNRVSFLLEINNLKRFVCIYLGSRSCSIKWTLFEFY